MSMNKLAREVEESLRKIIVPGFDVDLVSSGVIKSFRLSRDAKKIVVFVDFTSSDPACYFCKFINHTLWTTIARKIKETLKTMGFEEVYVVDTSTRGEL